MEWQQLIGFYHVAKLGSFTRAAEATFRTQSALTQQIKSLEEELGCRLFERIGRRKVILTAPGEKVLSFSESVLNDHERLLQDIGEYTGLRRGRLRIAAPFTTLYHLLPEMIMKYHTLFPWVELSLFDRPQKDVIEMIKGGDVDFGVLIESVIPGGLNKFPWKKVEPTLLTPQGHPLSRARNVSIENIVRYPLILPPRSSGSLNRNKLEEFFRRHNLAYHVIMESSNIELSALYVEMGLGISFASIVKGLPVLKKRHLAYISLQRYFTAEFICIVTRKDRKRTSFHEAFFDLIFDGQRGPMHIDP